MGLSVSAAGALWSGRALADTPKRGGHMRCGLNDANTIDSLDSTPVQRDDDDRRQPVHPGQPRRRRHRRRPGPEPRGELGGHPDAKVWRFRLRKGVEFSNGKTLTTEDVVNSINVHRGEDTKSAAKGVFAGISDVRVEGDDTVVVEVADANADLPLPVHRLPLQRRSDGGRQGRPALAPRNRLLPAARVRSGRAHGPGEEPERLAGGRGSASRTRWRSLPSSTTRPG